MEGRQDQSTQTEAPVLWPSDPGALEFSFAQLGPEEDNPFGVKVAKGPLLPV